MDAEQSTLARPYARATFDFAEAHDAVDHWREALGALASVVQEPRVAALVAAPKLTAADKAERLSGLLDDMLDDPQRNFVRLLADNGRLALLPSINSAFLQLRATQLGEVTVELHSARALDEASTEPLRARLGERFKGEVQFSIAEDPALLGGALLRVGDQVIDGSLRGRLATLATTLRAS